MNAVDPQLAFERLCQAMAEPAPSADTLTFHGRCDALPSVYAVSSFAAACVGSALSSLARLWALRNSRPVPRVEVDCRYAAAAFRSEAWLRALEGVQPAVWDPLAGDYATRDGFVRLHTNYAHHRDAALRALGVPAQRAHIAAALSSMSSEQVEEQVVAAGGAAAALRTSDEWAAHPQGRALALEPLVGVHTASASPLQLAPSALPLSGVRVLDLTRVIAGPVCTRVLAAYGAQVLRIDPPGFAEVPALLGDTTWGKRRAFVDLHTSAGRALLMRLLGACHVVVLGYRSGALEALGLSEEALQAQFPQLISARLSAYGHTGPWDARRGFDSLVQMSCGIAARGREVSRAQQPVPLPAQALDHGTGYLMAAAVAYALAERIRDGSVRALRLSLARTAELLKSLGDAQSMVGRALEEQEAQPLLEVVDSAFGPLRRVRAPFGIVDVEPCQPRAAGPLGVDEPRFV